MRVSSTLLQILSCIITVHSWNIAKIPFNTLARNFIVLPAACLALTCTSPLLPAHASTLAEQLAAMQAAQNAIDAQDVEWIPLNGELGKLGVSFRDYRSGKAEKDPTSPTVRSGSAVTTEMSIRMKKFATQNDPGGVRYYSTKIDTPANELKWTVGDGSILPSLEQGMEGMSKNSLRRIEIPSTLVFQARKTNQLPLPSSKDEEGQRRFKNLFKTDATLIFEVLVKQVQE